MKQKHYSNPIAIDLFSGVGGLSHGLAQAGFDVAIKIEIEDIAGRYAQYNAPSSHVLHGETRGDVRRFGKETPNELGLRIGELALIAGGPPCQGFSLAGRQRVDDPLNDLVLEFARVVDEFRPMAMLMENVPGITTAGSEKLRQAISRLEKNYRIIGPTKLNAWDFGVPQTRQRVFLVGIRRDLKIDPSLPQPTHAWSPNGQMSLMPATPTCWESISDLPEVSKYPFLASIDRVEYDSEPTNEFQRIMRGYERDPLDFSAEMIWDRHICTNLRTTQHGDNLTKRLEALEPGQADKISGIRRLEADGLSTTIRAGTTKERGSWSAPRPMHPFSPRVVTTRECARIQTFPDWFVFHPAKWHGNRMVGNAVPPLLARAIGDHLIKLLGIDRAVPDQELKRDKALIQADIEKAAASNYENRQVSQKVVSWGKRKLDHASIG